MQICRSGKHAFATTQQPCKRRPSSRSTTVVVVKQCVKPVLAGASDTTALHMDAFSLWLVPDEGPLYSQLKQQICSQAEAHGGPLFVPHVTVLGGIEGDEDEVKATAKSLAEELLPFTVEFESVGTGPTFHQCVFLRCLQTPAIMDAAWVARQRFGQPQDAPYTPHLSLLYSNCDEHTRKAACCLLQDSYFGPGATGADNSIANGFKATHLTVWLTPPDDLTLKSWTQVARFSLGSDQ